MFTKKEISSVAFQMIRYAYGVDRVINKNTTFGELGLNQYDVMLIVTAMETKFDVNLEAADVLAINSAKSLVDVIIRLLKATGRFKEERKPRTPRPEKVKLVDSPEETIDPDKESIPDEDPTEVLETEETPELVPEEPEPEPEEMPPEEPLFDAGNGPDHADDPEEDEPPQRKIVISDPDEEDEDDGRSAMYISSIEDIDGTPSLGAMIGVTHSPDALNALNEKWSSGGVAFGLPTNPDSENYRHFMGLVNAQINKTDMVVRQTMESILLPNEFRVINNETSLILMPPVMQVPMLMAPCIHDLFVDRKIWGWGWNPDSFPTEDAYGRLINNGRIEWDPKDPASCPEFIETEFRQDDPDLDEEQLKAVERSRRWLADWVEKEMSDEGSRRDPTDLANCISI